MKNGHLRFGWLTYLKSTEKSTTSIRLRLDRFIGELLLDPPRQAKAHLISVIGGDTQVAPVSAAISLGDRFLVEGPDLAPMQVCLGRNAQCFKGSLQLAGRKKPLRHIIGISEEFAAAAPRHNRKRSWRVRRANSYGLRSQISTAFLECRTGRNGS
jgi:hypothetical protein